MPLSTLLRSLAVALLVVFPAGAQARALVAAASDLQFALEEIAADFSERTGMQVALTYGSTGNLARQIREGAPIQLFLSADEDFALDLAADGLTRDEGRLYALGRLALVLPEGSALLPDASLADLGVALRDGRLRRFAIANPDHAPYGMRAAEALRHAGLWDEIQPRLVLGENVTQAAQFALSGNAEGGLIAYSLALTPQIIGQGTHVLIPQQAHRPLRQRMVLMRDAGPEATAFYEYLSSPPARLVMERYGFGLPED